jgi:hypothetical protein
VWDQDGMSAGMEQDTGELLVSDIWYHLMPELVWDQEVTTAGYEKNTVKSLLSRK